MYQALDDFIFLTVMDWHDDVIKWTKIPRYWPFVRGIHRPPVNSPHKGQWRGPLMFSLICAWINGWVNHGEAGDMIRHRAYNDVTVMVCPCFPAHWVVYIEAYVHKGTFVNPSAHKREGCQDDSPVTHCWGRWSLPLMSHKKTKTITLTIFPV